MLSSPSQSKPKALRCPQCRAECPSSKDNPWRPFCSRRCKLIDFGGWLDEFGLDDSEALPAKHSDPEPWG
ncbi:MAG: DNA gyrase inhibitor YacG [Oceanococcaceae bacterium]